MQWKMKNLINFRERPVVADKSAYVWSKLGGVVDTIFYVLTSCRFSISM